MHARHCFIASLLFAGAALLTGCSKSAPQPTGTYTGPHFQVRFDTTSKLTFVGQLGMPDIHAAYTQNGNTLHVVADRTAPKHFEATMHIEDGAKFIVMTQIKDLDNDQVMNDEERMSKVLNGQ